MFSLISTQRVKKCFFMSFVFVLLAVFLIACDTDSGSEPGSNTATTVPNGLQGDWHPYNEGGDWYKITSTTLTNGYLEETNWAGDVRHFNMFNGTTGVIIIELTNFGEGMFAKDRAKPFTAVYFLNYTPNESVELNGVSDSSAADWNADTATLQGAIDRFTFDNMPNYMDIAWSTPYSRK